MISVSEFFCSPDGQPLSKNALKKLEKEKKKARKKAERQAQLVRKLHDPFPVFSTTNFIWKYGQWCY